MQFPHKNKWMPEGAGRRSIPASRGAMVALLSERRCRPVHTAVTGRHLSRQQNLPDPADAITALTPVEVLAVDAARDDGRHV